MDGLIDSDSRDENIELPCTRRVNPTPPPSGPPGEACQFLGGLNVFVLIACHV